MGTRERAIPQPMSAQRALDINRRLCQAYFVQQGIQGGPMPSLADVSLEEAVLASRMVEEAGGLLNADGSQTYTCHVAQDAIAGVFARVVLANS
jgi:hypothetical protein